MHTPDPAHLDDRPADAQALFAELGLTRTASPPAPITARTERSPSAPASALEVLAAAPAHDRAAAMLVRIDADGRIALRDLADDVAFTSQPGDLVVHADRHARRLWLTPAAQPCDCTDCSCDEQTTPTAAFAASPLAGSMQSKHRLKLPRGLWSALEVKSGGMVLAVAADDDALLLASADQLVAVLLADVNGLTVPARTGETDGVQARGERTETRSERHLEVVA